MYILLILVENNEARSKSPSFHNICYYNGEIQRARLIYLFNNNMDALKKTVCSTLLGEAIGGKNSLLGGKGSLLDGKKKLLDVRVA